MVFCYRGEVGEQFHSNCDHVAWLLKYLSSTMHLFIFFKKIKKIRNWSLVYNSAHLLWFWIKMEKDSVCDITCLNDLRRLTIVNINISSLDLISVVSEYFWYGKYGSLGVLSWRHISIELFASCGQHNLCMWYRYQIQRFIII